MGNYGLFIISILVTFTLVIFFSIPMVLIHEYGHYFAFKHYGCIVVMEYHLEELMNFLNLHPNLVAVTTGYCHLTPEQHILTLWAGVIAEYLVMILMLIIPNTRYIGFVIASRSAFSPLLEFYNYFPIPLICSLISAILIVIASYYLFRKINTKEYYYDSYY